MSTPEYVDLAREAWDEAAPIHWTTTQKLADELRDPGTMYLHAIHADELIRLGIAGSRVAQLNCNNGRELISLMRLGAAGGVGFDISEGFITQARELAAAAGTPEAQFVATDVYGIDESYNGRYDIVVVTAGALCFMPDLDEYFRVAHRLLKPGGYLSLYEGHPITEMFLLDRDRGDDPLTFVYSYFDKSPIRHTTGLDYIHNEAYDAKPIYYFHHTLSDIVSSILDLGLRIDRFVEHDQDPSQALQKVEAMSVKPPLSFILTAQKDPEAGADGA
jgi:SAM-dependent methyltransferase